MAEVAENSSKEQQLPSVVTTATSMDYEESGQDPYKKAITYLEKHNILQIFQSMTAAIIYQKPDNPLDFMISEIGEMKKHKDSEKARPKE